MSDLTNNQKKSLAEQKIGGKLNPGQIRHAVDRLYQQATGDIHDKQWKVAYQHIALHFHPQKDKKKHTQFAKGFCNEGAIRELLKQALHHNSEATPSLLTDDDGDPTGRPCIVVLRYFGQRQIGIETDQHTLKIVGDWDGNLVTAHPLRSPSSKGL